MLALTLTEPWATLMMLQEKHVETRSWRLPPNMIGKECAIHSAKGFPKWAKETCQEEPFLSSLKLPNGLQANVDMHRTHLLCIVRFTENQRTEYAREHLSEKELAFGDYADGRDAWMSEYVEQLLVPVQAVGHLGFWEWDGRAH